MLVGRTVTENYGLRLDILLYSKCLFSIIVHQFNEEGRRYESFAEVIKREGISLFTDG